MKKLFAYVVFLALAVLLAKQSLVLLGLAATSALGWYLARGEKKSKRLGMTLAPAVFGAVFGWMTSGFVQNAQSIIADFTNKPTPAEPLFQAWLGLAPVELLHDQVGLYAVLVGGFIGLIFIIYHRPKDRHAPGRVAGKPVVQGGWASLNDLEDKCDFGAIKKGAGGIPLGKLEGQVVKLNPQKGKIKIAGHTLIVGATGTGKSYTCIRNMIVSAVCDGHSVVITDPKGELFETKAQWLKKQGYELIGFNVANPNRSHRWNSLAECQDWEEIMDLAGWLISAAGDDHSFFSGGEKNVLAAVCGYTRWVLPEHQRHMRSALSLLAWPQEELDNAFKKAFKSKQLPQACFETWSSVQGHYKNYVEGCRNKLRIITKAGLAALSAGSDFTLENIGKKKTALFLILPDEGDLQGLYVPFYTFFFRRLRQAAEVTGSGRLPVPVRFILDEFANIGKIPDIDKVCALGRSRGITVQISLQNIGQLQGLYRKNNEWKAVVGNCPIKICLSVDDMDSAKFFADTAGKARVRDITESRDVSTPWDALEVKKRESTKDVVVINPYEILQMPEDDCIVTLRGKRPIYMQKMPWTELKQYKAIVKAGQLRPEEALPAVDQNISIPDIPVGEDEPPKPSRGRKPTKKETPVVTAEENQCVSEAVETLGMNQQTLDIPAPTEEQEEILSDLGL